MVHDLKIIIINKINLFVLLKHNIKLHTIFLEQ